MLENITDLGITLDGDLLLNERGDLAIVGGDQWIIRELVKIIKTNNPEWGNHPDIGADLDDFIGRSNTRETAKEVEEHMRDAIRKQFPDQGLDIRVVPLGRHQIGVYVAFGTYANDQRKLINFKFDFTSNGVTSFNDPLLVGKEDEYFKDSIHHVNTNKYLTRRGLS
jgi:hypothetical protein